ncbi:MAG: LytR C-terminal domain-containing protein [Propionibacteriaceae bacterium]|nr:LytR C-terminal domain-containing protein [Micropruina sp.]HBX81739.1 hypothetical protein [Propionibacteriaceae bacterium]HBY23193.1 hypothetical protein [Propionibacteriaceae bacterium]
MSAREIWRRIKTPLTLLLLLGFVWWAGSWAIKAASAPSGHSAIPCVMTNVGPALTPDRVLVRVYNGGTTAGLAKLTSTQLRAYNFKVQKTTNTNDRITATVIVGNAAENPEVKLVMGFFKGATFKADGRPDHSVDVYVGTPFGGWTDNPVKSIPVTGPVCLSADLTPNATASASAPAATPAAS